MLLILSIITCIEYSEPIRSDYATVSFDEGPSENIIPLLEILKEHDLFATFHLSPNRMNQSYLAEIKKNGHDIGLYAEELPKDYDEFVKQTGIRPTLCRLPYYGYDDELVEKAEALGMIVTKPNLDSEDNELDDWITLFLQFMDQTNKGVSVLFRERYDKTLRNIGIALCALKEKYEIVDLKTFYGIGGVDVCKEKNMCSSSTNCNKQKPNEVENNTCSLDRQKTTNQKNKTNDDFSNAIDQLSSKLDVLKSEFDIQANGSKASDTFIPVQNSEYLVENNLQKQKSNLDDLTDNKLTNGGEVKRTEITYIPIILAKVPSEQAEIGIHDPNPKSSNLQNINAPIVPTELKNSDTFRELPETNNNENVLEEAKPIEDDVKQEVSVLDKLKKALSDEKQTETVLSRLNNILEKSNVDDNLVEKLKNMIDDDTAIKLVDILADKEKVEFVIQEVQNILNDINTEETVSKMQGADHKDDRRNEKAKRNLEKTLVDESISSAANLKEKRNRDTKLIEKTTKNTNDDEDEDAEGSEENEVDDKKDSEDKGRAKAKAESGGKCLATFFILPFITMILAS